MAANKRGLGRGLDALLGNVDTQHQQSNVADGILQYIALDLIYRGKYQPRREIDPQALQELADSIKTHGVMQPIVVRASKDNRYEIIAGERRWRASLLIGLDVIPAIIRDVNDQAVIAMALIENIQRENLNAIEEAMAMQRLQDEFNLTHKQVAAAVGKSRATVANLIRLLSLNDDVIKLVSGGEISMGHARAILSLSDELQIKAAAIVVLSQLSVRQTEALVKRLLIDASENISVTPEINKNHLLLEQHLTNQLGSSVNIKCGLKGKGKLIINYNSADELDQIIAHIK